MSVDLSLIVCPACYSDVKVVRSILACTGCGRIYAINDDIPDTLIVPGFQDEEHEERWCCEEGTGAHMITRYLVPLLDKLFPSTPREDIRVLSIGCGVGIDTELLNAAGFYCRGIDAGNRTKMWASRRGPKRFCIAGVQRMPFRAEQFDFAFMNCVLPHVGVFGDTYRLRPDHAAERARAVADTIRVVKRSGYILVANPNRLCPFDLFHRNNEDLHIPRLHSPTEPFLQSFRDHKVSFVVNGSCSSIETLPFDSFWGFSDKSKSSRYALGQVLQALVRQYFRLLSLPVLAFLRRTAVNPWLVVLIKK
jgi:SAM-dependent methyltransferase